MRPLLVLLLAVPLPAANWPQWRGPAANGVSDEKAVPVQWKVVWKAPLAGLGASTPILWGDQIFLTAQLGDGPFEQRGRDLDPSSGSKPTAFRRSFLSDPDSAGRMGGWRNIGEARTRCSI